MLNLHRSLRARLLGSFLIATALPLAVLGLYAVPALESATLAHLLANLTATARLAAAEAAAEPRGPARRQRMVRWARVLGIRIALINYEGKDVAASGPLPRGLLAEPGVDPALSGKVVQGQISDGAGVRWLYAAAPVEEGAAAGEVVDLLVPLRSVEGVFARVRLALAIGYALAAVLAGGLVLYLTQALFGPIASMKAEAERIGRGNLREQIPERADELGDLARVLNTMARDLNERENLRRDFLANVSHELRTPVANMQFTAQALLAGADADPERHRQMLDTIGRETERLARLLRQLLDLLRFQSGRFVLTRSPVDAPDLLMNLAARFAVRAEAQGVRLEASPRAGLPPIDGDPDRLAEVLDNLVDNALRSTPSGGAIQLAAGAADASVILTVADTGRGIAEHDLPFVFEKFYRGGPARDRASGGSGLGLAIVKAIVDAHGGLISVSSRAGRGTTFVIRLPAAASRPVSSGMRRALSS
ncbi:MAG TPA: HAMP domain-containing sensor histidine kinase [bacterium]|nr:HAMP domain-containing sensor histidine kinase [bacterium]